eukprot:GHVU01006346.1.p1 GENE.GHVU01006346.1~~GHVU01006346.1.p1  ORF type:complete len:343 (+),score=38.92 GHVU01006346.1:58-1086(+)
MNFGYHHQGQMPFQKPEGALKRANELISIGQHMAALELLHGTIQHKKFRTLNNDSHVESVLTLFVDLCVKLDKFKHVREGLIQNRNLAQQTNNMATFGRVLVDFRSKAEARLKAAKRRGGSVGVAAGDTPAEVEAAKGSAADETAGETAGAAAEAGATETAVAVDTVEDLESAATPESLMQALLQTESGDGAAKEVGNACLHEPTGAPTVYVCISAYMYSLTQMRLHLMLSGVCDARSRTHTRGHLRVQSVPTSIRMSLCPYAGNGCGAAARAATWHITPCVVLRLLMLFPVLLPQITTAMRLCLDAYKMILDLSRQAPSLEKVYHETARAVRRGRERGGME